MSTPIPLPFQSKIKFPVAGTLKEETYRLSFGGGYSQRMRKSSNAQTGKWQITWTGLTTAEMIALSAAIKGAGGVTLFLWQSPVSTTTQRWSIVDHAATQIAQNHWDYTAELILEYA